MNHNCLTRRIGNTTYRVRVHFDNTGRETMEDKILHLIRNEALDIPEKRGIIKLPQMSRQPEGSQ